MKSMAHVRGIEMAYEDAGQGAPLLLLHGFPFNRSMWRAQVEALSARYRVVAPDLRGHGDTTVTSELTTMEEMAADVASLLDELNIERVVLGGLSMGGYVALAFYRRSPERVRALVLADTRAGADTAEARRNREETATRVLREGMQPIADAMPVKLLSRETIEGKPETLARVREMILDTVPEGAAAALRGMAVRRDQTELLREINVPTLILVGSEDSVTPVKDSEAMHREIKGAQLKIIEGAGHVSNMERPAEFNRALADFPDSLEPRGEA